MSLSRCPHCGAEAATGDVYCCAGCRVAHALLRDAGLERYYALADAPLPRGGGHSDRSWLDDGAVNVVLDVQGITCAACVWVIEKLAARHGIACRVNPALGRLSAARGAVLHLPR